MPESTQHRRRDPVPRRLWVLLGLCVVLSAIGFVQYRWIDEVAGAQRERAVAALNASVSRFRSDFDAEIARIHFTFQVPVPGQSSDIAAAMQYRLRKWRELAPYPRLIAEVQVVESERTHPEFVIRGIGPSPAVGTAFQTTDGVVFQAPSGVTPVESGPGRPEFIFRGPRPATTGGVMAEESGRVGPKYVLGAGGTPVSGGMALHTRNAVGTGVFPGLAIEFGDAPGAGAPHNLAMVMPLMPRIGLRMGGPGRPGIVTVPVPSSSARISFDLSYIQREFIPDLIIRAFPEQHSEVQILITSSTRPDQIVWKSEPGGHIAQAAPDLAAPFFALRPECLVNGMSGESFSPASPDQMQDALLRQVLGQRTAACDQLPPDRLAGSWKIFVRYRAGSVDAVISRFRYRSLGLSLGVLLVLFLAAAMLVVSTERARRLAETQMEFAAGVSHELRTPLSVIRVAADNLSQGMVENETQARRYGNMIGAQVQHLSALVAEVLLFSSSEASLEIPGMEAVSVDTIVSDALAHCAADLGPAGFEVRRDLQSPLPEVLASRHLATQCLVNIMQNAIKYARAGRFIGIEAAACDHNALPGVRIDIVDRGPGIPPDELSHVFEPFYRGREARSSQTSGLGLGLSIVRRIVTGHGGHITVRSRPSVHTCFSIWLPAGASGSGRALLEAGAVRR
ncbi:MAG: HAMP domain-containing histidine kinase [Acidobacteria bacterium]|nr:HAMP domain-containing histidine kinase [Acidobacteriota bacterium]